MGLNISSELVVMVINSVLAIVAVIGLIFSFYWNRKTLTEMKNQRLTSSRPVLSQKIVREEYSVGQIFNAHFMLKVKNFGKGTAFKQTFIDYKFYHDEKLLLDKKSEPIIGAYDDIEPLKERPLDLSLLFQDDWGYNQEGIIVDGVHCNFIEIRLPYEDIQGYKCCSCTRYMYNAVLSGLYGKIERFNWYSASSEFSNEKCKKCNWRNSSENGKDESEGTRLWFLGAMIGIAGNLLVSSGVEIATSDGLDQIFWYGLYFLSAIVFGIILKKSAQILDISTKKIDAFTITLLISALVGIIIKFCIIPYLFT